MGEEDLGEDAYFEVGGDYELEEEDEELSGDADSKLATDEVKSRNEIFRWSQF